MSVGFALWRGNSRDLDWGNLSLTDECRLLLDVNDHTAHVSLERSRSPYVDAYVAADWLCAVGGADLRIVLGRHGGFGGPTLGLAGLLERSAAGDRFEFENHSVRFHDRPGRAQCVLAWEIGVGLVDRDEGLVWTHVHGDPNQRLMRITDNTVELRGRFETISVALENGEATVQEFSSRRADNSALDEWMRSIGR